MNVGFLFYDEDRVRGAWQRSEHFSLSAGSVDLDEVRVTACQPATLLKQETIMMVAECDSGGNKLGCVVYLGFSGGACESECVALRIRDIGFDHMGFEYLV